MLSLCIGQFECGTALKAYYSERPHLKSYVKKKKKRLEDILGDKLLYTLPAIAVIAAGGTAQVKISRQFSCGAGDGKTICYFHKSF